MTFATEPVHDYGRTLGVSVTGGYVYRGRNIPALHGTYVFGDYQSARIWSFTYHGAVQADFQERTAEINPGSPKRIGSISSFGEDALGELYICDYSDGEIYKIVPAISAPAISQASIVGNQVGFSFSAEVGQAYVVEYRDSLFEGTWQTLASFPAPAANTNIQVTNELTAAQRFYRVRVN